MSYLAHIGNTVFGMYQLNYNKEWDAKLNQLLDAHSQDVKLADNHCTITLGEWGVWISNKWYSYGNAWRIGESYVPENLRFRPSIRTMQRLDKLVQKIEQDVREEKKRKTKAQAAEMFSLEALK